jgi:protein-disulfide isomerase
MKSKLVPAALAISLALAGCNGGGDANRAANVDMNAALPQIPAPNNGDWTQMVQETPEGGWRMGNPDAPVKLVEYASISCGGCAAFAEQGSEPLRERYVRSGQVSWEYRPFIIFPTDPGIFMLLRCRGAQPFFRLTDQLYATQRQWLAQAQSQAATVQALPQDQQIAGFVRAAGVDAFFRQSGMPAGQVDSCLADRAALQRLLDNSQRYANEDNVSSTPTFHINGEEVDVRGWSNPNPALSLEGRLRAAIGS